MNRRRVVLLTLFALAEASVIEPILMIVPTPLRTVDPLIALGATWALLCGIAFTRRGLAQREASAMAQRLALGGWLVGMLLLSLAIVEATHLLDTHSLSVVFVEFTGVALIWWRGVALGSTSLGPDAARVRLQLGLLLFVIFAVLTAFNPENNLVFYILPFLAGAVFAMPLAHIDYVEHSETGRPVPMDAKWWRSLGAGVSVPLIASMAVAALLTGDTIGQGLRLLIGIILLPVLAVAFVIGYIITWIVSLIFSHIKRNPLEALQNLGALFRQPQQPTQQSALSAITISPELRYALGMAALAAIIIALIWLTGRARRETEVIRASGDDLLDPGEDEPPPPPATESGFLRSFNLRRWLAAVTIRRIYARMAHEAAKRGYARQPAQTPSDYLPGVCAAFPAMDADVHLITAAYISAHYGEVPDTDEALGKIRAAWERVRATPRRAPGGQPSQSVS